MDCSTVFMNVKIMLNMVAGARRSLQQKLCLVITTIRLLLQVVIIVLCRCTVTTTAKAHDEEVEVKTEKGVDLTAEDLSQTSKEKAVDPRAGAQ